MKNKNNGLSKYILDLILIFKVNVFVWKAYIELVAYS